MGARILRRRRNNPGEQLPYGEWVPAHAVRFNDDGTVSLMTDGGGVLSNRGRRRNVAAGFYDEDGYFHPIRASYDYSRSRAGEPPLKRKSKKKKRRAKRR